MAKKPKTKINIKLEEGEEPLEFDILQKEIVKLSNAGKTINQSRMRRRTIVLLLNDVTGVPKTHINIILNALPELERMYLK